jgi:uncharacterized membrane protein
MNFKDLVDLTGKTIDAAGVVVIAAGIVYFTVRAVGQREVTSTKDRYRTYRQGIGRVILLGLELLVAGDIIRTVAVSPTFRTAGVLAVIVLIRTFLSFTLEVELEGRWPWQQRDARPPTSSS